MTKFTAGTTYTTRSAADSSCEFVWTVTKRTAKTITVKGDMIDGEQRFAIKTRDGVEFVMPLGRYSMAPVMRADRGFAPRAAYRTDGEGPGHWTSVAGLRVWVSRVQA